MDTDWEPWPHYTVDKANGPITETANDPVKETGAYKGYVFEDKGKDSGGPKLRLQLTY